MLDVRFEAVRRNDGFDPHCAPQWLMCPLRNSKQIRLLNGKGATVASTSPCIASVEETPTSKSASFGGKTRKPVTREAVEGKSVMSQRAKYVITQPDGEHVREFTVKGLMPGRSFIEARVNGGLVAMVEVNVKPEKIVKISFNFVEDSAGHSTGRNPASVEGWLTEMNEIYKPQTNVVCQRNNVRTVRVPSNLGDVVRYSSHLEGVAASEHEWGKVVALRDGTADFNFFFVWEYEQDNTPATDHTDAGALQGNCIFEDEAGAEVAETLAHELGHFLGVKDFYDNDKIDWLMYGYTDTRGRRIPRDHARTMNR